MNIRLNKEKEIKQEELIKEDKPKKKKKKTTSQRKSLDNSCRFLFKLRNYRHFLFTERVSFILGKGHFSFGY